MKLEKREFITIGVGALIVVFSLIYGLAKRHDGLGGAAEAGTIDGQIARLAEYKRVKDSVEQLKKDLGVSIPQTSVAEQETMILDDIGQRARQKGLQYSSLKPAQNSKSSSGVKPLQFRVEVSGRFASFAEFIEDIENAPLPYVVKEIHIDSSTRAPRDQYVPQSEDPDEDPGPPPPGNGSVRAALKIQSYLFPDIGTKR